MDKNKQLIIYGAPGTRKSYMIDNYIEADNNSCASRKTVVNIELTLITCYYGK